MTTGTTMFVIAQGTGVNRNRWYEEFASEDTTRKCTAKKSDVRP